MNRRAYFAALCGAGVAATAGCSTVAGERTLSDPTVRTETDSRRSLVFTADGEEVATFGADGSVESGVLDVSTRIWHREGTDVDSITLRVWMPQTASESASEVALVSPVEGDSSPPPSVALYTPDRGPGTVIEVTDLKDLADETISTLDLLVRPASKTATTLAIDATIELAGSGVLKSDYTLDGELRLELPERSDQSS